MMQWDEGEAGETRKISADAWICFNGAKILEAKNEFECHCLMGNGSVFREYGCNIFWFYFFF